MAPWGKKSDKGDDLDAKKSSLFGRSSKASKSPAPTAANPYAAPPPSNNPYAQQSNNPYATQNGTNDPYAPKSQSSLSQPPTSSFGSLTLNSEQGAPPAYGSRSSTPNRYEKSPVPQGGYGGDAPRFQSQGSYGQAGGYGSDPYGNGQPQSRAGGYGQLGRTNSQDTVTTDAGRNALFGDAPKRVQQQREQASAMGESSDASYSNAGASGLSSGMPGGYGADADRELTAEEQADQEADASKNEIKFVKQQTVASARNALRVAEQVRETAMSTTQTLNSQGDSILRAEKQLDVASFNNDKAEQKAKELKSLNRSMFAIHMDNPFTKTRNYEEAIQREVERRQHERATLEATQQHAYQSMARHQGTDRQLGRGNGASAANKSGRNLADRAKYQFEADSEDDEMENEIEDNLVQIGAAVQHIKGMSQAMGQELDAQNKHIARISQKTEKVDDQIVSNTARLNRIK